MPSVDHISDLNDDLLLHVLRFLSDDARDVVRTSALSTRWRSLWTRAPVLCLDSSDVYEARFNDFLHNVLARRAYDADVETLKLRTWLWPGKSRADVWLRRAMRHTVGSLKFEMWTRLLTAGEHDDDDAGRLRARVDLPRCTRATEMSLELNQAALLLPPAVEFHNLTELTLRGIEFSDDDGQRLGHLLSSPSCCPRLRKLKLSHLSGLHDLRLDGGVLETLYLADLHVRRLDVDAPRLLALTVVGYFMHPYYRVHTSLTVRAPALEKLETSLDLDQLRLLFQHFHIQLLQECRPIHGHTLYLYGPDKLTEGDQDEAIVEIPQLPGVTDLTIKFCSNNSHYLGATVTSLLARCNNLKYLNLDNQTHLQYGPPCEEGCVDCDLHGSWKDKAISLEHLREVELGGFSGQEHYCVDMLHLLLASTPALKRMIVTAKTSVEGWLRPKLMLAESLESRLPRGRGKWTTCRAANATTISEYQWMPDLEMQEML